MSTKKTELDRVKTILAKNVEYLKNHPAAGPTVTMKVHSNQVIARLQIETIENEIIAFTELMKKQGCSKCL